MTAPTPTLHAWVDESIHDEAAGGFYVLAATVADEAGCELIRERLQALLRRGGDRLHWVAEPAHRRTEIAQKVALLDLAHVIVVGAPLMNVKTERARRQIMERLMYELVARDVERVWIESRTNRENSRDLHMVDALRSKKVVPADFRVDHARPSTDPMLWLPDIVAGAVRAHRMETDSVPYSSLRETITEVAVELR